MAFAEHLVDFVSGLLAMAGRRTGAERRFERRNFCGLPPDPSAGHAPGLARQIIQRQLQGLEPAAEACGIDQAIGRGNGSRRWRRCWPEGVHTGIRPEEKDTWRMLRVFDPALAQLWEIFPRIEELEGGEPASAALSDDLPLGHRTRRHKLHQGHALQ